jgi:hypothetical protein
MDYMAQKMDEQIEGGISENMRLADELERATNELTVCRALLDSYGFHQVGIHNGITAMQNRILNLESLLKSYD